MMVRLRFLWIINSHFKQGLGFSEEDQAKPTKSFSGGWRCVWHFGLYHNTLVLV